MQVSIIVACSLNNAIGKNNQLLWHLPADLKHFKTVTMGCPIIMGRKTFESIGKPLPGRKNIVITRNLNYNVSKQFDIIVVNNLEQAFDYCKNENQLFIIGGGDIYKQSLPFTNTIYKTLVHNNIDGDTYFPEINLNEFKLVNEEKLKADDKNQFDYAFQTYTKI